MPDLSGIPVVGGALNAVGIGEPDKPTTTADTSARDAQVATLAAKHGGIVGKPTAMTTKPNAAGDTTKTGYDLYTFADGSSIEFKPDGSNQNYKQSAVATRAPTAASQAPANVLAASGGPVIVGSGANTQIWQKTGVDENGKAIYAQTDESKATQALADAKTAADTTKAQADAKKAQADAALAADPTNVALKQAKDAADIAQSQAATAASQATIAHQQITDQLAQAKSGPDIDLTKAQTGVQVATAQKTTALLPTDVQSAQLAVQKAQQDLANNPQDQAAKLALSDAQTKYQNALAASTANKANEPTLQATGTTAPTNTYWDPTTNSFVDRANPAYTPTDPGRMTAQLQQQAAAKQTALQQLVTAGKLTSDQASSQFDDWWKTNIEPVKGDIAAAQAKAQSALDLQNAQTANYQMTTAMQPATLAQTASDNAQRNTVSMLPYVTGKGFDQAFGQALSGGWKGLNPQAVAGAATYSLPNLQEIGRQGAAAALANISPTAQMHLQSPGPPGQPPVPGMPSPTDLLQRSQYGSFGPPPGTPAPAQPAVAQPAQPAVAAPAVPPGMINPWYQQQYGGGGGAGMPATGPVVGDTSSLGTNWSWPPYTPGG